MLKPYFGEFLIHPVPLEMSLGACGYQCAYCFARRLRKGDADHTTSIVSLANILNGKSGQTTLHGQLLNDGYPVLLSNRTDPLAPGAWPYAVQVIDLLSAFGKPFTIQTKGGTDERIERVIRAAPGGKCVWYFTIETDDDSIRRRIAPNAPPIEQRIRNIENIIKSGQRVVVGINPCDWHFSADQYKGLIQRLAAIGVYGIWGEILHVNSKELERYSADDISALGGAEYLARVARYSARNIDDERLGYLYSVLDHARACGMETYTYAQPEKTGFFDVFYQTYEKLFPINQNFINFCHDEQPSDIISFDQYWRVLTADHSLPQGIFTLDSFIACADRSFIRSGKRLKTHFRDLCAELWEKNNHKTITGNVAFDDVGDLEVKKQTGKDVHKRDQKGRIYIHFFRGE